MKNEIKQSLQQLIGFEFTRTTRAGATECLKFGIFLEKDRKASGSIWNSFIMHVENN